MRGTSTYLNFNGDCEEAFRFYAECLGARLDGLFRYGDSPMKDQAGPERAVKVMHATLMVGSTPLMGADAPDGRYQRPQGFSVSLSAESVEEAERVFAKLSEGGQVVLPLQQTSGRRASACWWISLACRG